MKQIILLAVLTGLLTGCGKADPTLSGGKPIGYWLQALRNSDPRLRREAAFKLGNAGPVEESVTPALVASLRDPDERVRREAIVALAKFGRAAREAVPALVELQQNDVDARTRAYATQALENLRD